MAQAHVISDAAERLRQLPQGLDCHEGFVQVLAALEDGKSATLDGVWGSSCALLAARLEQLCEGTLAIVLPQSADVDEMADDLRLFSAAAPQFLPLQDSDPGDRILYDESYGERLRLLKALVAGDVPPLVVTSIQALQQPLPDRAAISSGTRTIRVAEHVDVQALAQWLVEQGFHHTTAVELPGEFSVRGGILDLFALDGVDPVRIEFFDDEVESIRSFDVATQRSIDQLDGVDLTVLEPSRKDREHLASYLPAGSWYLLLEPQEVEEEAKQFVRRSDDPESLHSCAAVMKQITHFPSAWASGLSEGTLDAQCHLQIESVERFSGDLQRVREELDSAGAGNDVFLVCQTEAEMKRLDELFHDSQLRQSGKLHFSFGALRSGFRLVGDQVVLISGGELFQRTDLARRSRRRLGRAIDSFLDLREGDLVVHLAHGIGRYRGLQLLEGQTEEHLQIEFHGRTKVFVPASKIDLVQKYVGSTRGKPNLARVGGRTWIRQKQAAERAVADLACDMLDLQAARQSRPGIAFPQDTEWQNEFDASFPYVETGDQLQSINAIKQDMQRDRPMDRLLCGDVGFGKTELAIRAAFKAVDSGYQVAILVPTTILAEQHHRTFRQRMAEFPFEVAALSRFGTPARQRQIVAGLEAGAIDIVIGTHRLASSDVQFHNLGLVIIDEEQRFGVAIKERLKALRHTVDVLTMTATPIPRTLHFSILGLRDISNLETAPEDRLAVETRVTRFQNDLVRHAILRELNRNGQIYFVHNRVNDIHVVAQRLREIVPEATFAVAHGQMPETELERVMLDFVDHKFDVLVATTIIESGLDIPNANTIFVDEADRYGLADLHQLRGRVGRFKHRAYCYLLIDPDKHLSPNAARRLRAIEEFSEMGAGFAIAMRDLEIRGAGNILGTEQSGHIATVGYELYCELLEEAVRKMKKMPPKAKVEVAIDLPVEAYLPRQYVPDMRSKIDMYRRLTRQSSESDVSEMWAELIDRFGPPPPPVERLFELAHLRVAAHHWGIVSIYLEDDYVVLKYRDRALIQQLRDSADQTVRIVDGQSAYVPIDRSREDAASILLLVKTMLRAD